MQNLSSAETGAKKPYNPREIEDKIYRLWEKSGYFNPDNLPAAKSYVILLPPPNITGSLHLGHALNATISDILIRYHRLKGLKTAWLPGIDHAGIATQNVVEKELKKEGKTRFDLSREKFIKRIWQWKEKYGGVILEQLKKIGASCDWSRTRFTLDPSYSYDVVKTFVYYYKKGLIYRGERVINWCPRCQTGLSDLEIEYREEKTSLWHIKYPLKNNGYIIVATTRPETMLGDAAVAVNPKDKRYKKLIGASVILPIQNRTIPIIADSAIDQNFGTGAVKVTPAHDLSDAEIAERHKLPFYQIINERGRMTEKAGNICQDLKTLECREKVIAELQRQNLIEKIEDYTHNASRCYRCSAALEPILSRQWFVKMTPHLQSLALKAAQTGKIKIIPKNFKKPYINWLKNVKDWCVSRQIWWGHRLPVWFCKNKNNGQGENFSMNFKKPIKCPFCENCEMEQSADVLDTWFSSALWPFAGLTEKDIKEFYPSAVLITARDIINLWVGRMIFSGLEFKQKEPFPKILIHATILTKDGRRMSKSLGTGVDPLTLIENYGADALRFGLIWQTMGNQDVRWSEEHVLAGKKFANKIWNASRFVISRIADSKYAIKNTESLLKNKNLTNADKKILTEIITIKKKMEKQIKKYEFGQTLHELYDFFWHQFCDIYLEETKKQDPKTTNPILISALYESLKLLHPFMPFITEEIYQQLPIPDKKLLMIEKW